MNFRHVIWVAEVVLWYFFIYLLLFAIKNDVTLYSFSIVLVSVAVAAFYIYPFFKRLRGIYDECEICNACEFCKSCGKYYMCEKCEDCEDCFAEEE